MPFQASNFVRNFAKRTPVAGMRTEGAVNVVGGGVVGSCDRAPVLADPHFGDVVLPPLVKATVSNLPDVEYQSPDAYCVPYSFFNVFFLAGRRLSWAHRRYLERAAKGDLTALSVVAHALNTMPKTEWSATRVLLLKEGYATATDFVLDPSTRGAFVMGDGLHAVGIWITDTQGLIADAADQHTITLTREALHRHCKLAVGSPDDEGCVIYQLSRRTPKKSK
jgi:hypothetical protein